MKALEVIKRTAHLGQPVAGLFDRTNICGIPTEIQIKNMAFPTFEQATQYLLVQCGQVLDAFTLESESELMPMLERWDQINRRENSFFISSFIATLAFDPSSKSYFKKLEYKELIANEMKVLQFELDKRDKKNKTEADIDGESDLTTYFDLSTTIQTLLSLMTSSKNHLYDYLDKTLDYVYFVHLGVPPCHIDQT
jgi:hypothetical protein